ncbi:MAG: helix-turn-helix domain-containing protein [Jannaschia sp.]
MSTPEPLRDVIRARLILLKRERGLTSLEMAEQCGLAKASLDRYLAVAPIATPGAATLFAIASGMGVSIDWLCGRTEIRMLRRAA